MTNYAKMTTVDINNIQPRELIYIELALYNVNSIHVLTSLLTVVCAKTRMIWIFPIASKISPVYITRFILTTLNNEQHPCKRVRVDEYGALENSTDVTNLLFDDFNIYMETTGGDT